MRSKLPTLTKKQINLIIISYPEAVKNLPSDRVETYICIGKYQSPLASAGYYASFTKEGYLVVTCYGILQKHTI